MSTLVGLAVVGQILATFGPPFVAWIEADPDDLDALRRARQTRRALARATRRS